MFKSLRESVRSLLSNSTNDKGHSPGSKRKRSLSAESEEDDPDIQIIKVEKKRRLNTENPFSSIVHLPAKMADWVRLKTKAFSDQFAVIDQRQPSGSRDSAWKKNGAPPRNVHIRSRGLHEAVTPQPRPVYQNQRERAGHGGGASRVPNDANVNTSSQHNGDRRSSTSSWSRQNHNHSSGMRSIRLKEREEYEKLLKLQSRYSASSSPSRVTWNQEQDGFSVSSSSSDDVNILCNKSIFSQSTQSSNTSIQTPRYKPAAPKILTLSSSSSLLLPSETSTHIQRYRTDEPFRNNMAELLAKQRRRTAIELPPSQTQSTSAEPSRHIVESRRSTVESKSSHSKDSVVIVDDDDDVAVKADRGTPKSCDLKQSSYNVTDNGVSSKSQNISLDFRDSVYMKPHYMEKLKNSTLMHHEQWKRQVKEEQMKANTYEAKRRAQSIELERRLKHQMKIFDEPEVVEEIFIEREEEEEEEALPELTADMMKMVHSALAPGPQGEVLSDAFRLQITRKDLATLAGLNWLNDEVINFYMNMLMERGEKEGMSKVYAFNTFFYPKIMQGGHGAVKRWTKKVDIFAMHYILIPVHLGMHWCLCVADMKDKKITYYDSMHGRNKDCLPAVLKYIDDESKAKKQTPINSSEWKLVMAEDNPQQLNGSDCGMFSCKYAEYISRGKELSFTQEDMPYFRYRMVYEILTKKLLQ